MSYLGGSIAFLWNLVQLWTGRANSAWGSSRTWGSGTSFETDVGTWTTRANTAYDTGTWGSGNTWQTDYNNEVTSFNALQNGLNNPDGETTVAVNYASLPTNGTTATTTLTIPRTGHFVIGCVIDGSASLNSFGDGVTITLSGIIASAKASGPSGWNNSGTMNFSAGWIQHGDYTSGQTLSVSITTAFIASGSASGVLYAHFIPNAAHHN